MGFSVREVRALYVRRQGAPTRLDGFYGEKVRRRRRASGACIAAENPFVMGIK